MQNPLPDRLGPPHKVARVFVQGDEVGSLGRRHVPVFVLTVGGVDDDQIAVDGRGATAHVVGKHAKFPDHVVGPDHVGIGPAVAHLAGERSIVLRIEESVGVERDNLAPVADVVEAISVNTGRRADPLEGPVVCLTGREFVVHHLPEERAVRLAERHEDPLVLEDVGIAGMVVVGTDEDPPVRNNRIA